MRRWVAPLVIAAMVFGTVLVGGFALDAMVSGGASPEPTPPECFDFGVPTATPTPPGDYECR